MSDLLEVTARVLVTAEPDQVWRVAMDWSRQREWMLATRVSGGTGLGTFEVARSGRQSEFRWTEQLRLPWPLAGELGRWTVAPVARWGLNASLRRFARLV